MTCLTRLWHPNINETGDVCLRYCIHYVVIIFYYYYYFVSILRETSIDGTGWSPARRLKVMNRQQPLIVDPLPCLLLESSIITYQY